MRHSESDKPGAGQGSGCGAVRTEGAGQGTVGRTRFGRRLAAIIVVIGVAIALVVWPSHSPCPIRLAIVGVEPSGLYDDHGSEFLLSYVVLSGRNNMQVSINTKTVQFQARIRNHWVRARRASSVAGVALGGFGGIPILVPAGTVACRMRFIYHYWPRPGIEQRLLGWAFRNFPRLGRSPIFGPLLMRRYFFLSSHPSAPHWLNAVTPATVLPKQPDHSHQSR